MESLNLQFALLGPLQIRRGTALVDIGAHKQRVLIATLLCRPNTVMSVDQLIDAVWEEAPPRTARKNLQAYVSSLRKVVGDRLAHSPYGYSIHCAPAELDVLGFEDMAAQGREAARRGELGDAAEALAGALRLWRGPFLSDVPHSAFLTAMAARLAAQRLRIYEDWSELAIALGEYREVLDTIDDIADAHPDRERLTAVKLVALCQCGRREEALGYYESVRVRMASALGIDPSPRLQQMFHRMLSGEPVVLDARTASSGGPAPLGGGPSRADARSPVTMASPVRPAPAGSSADDALLPGVSAIPRDAADFTGRAREIGTIIESLCSGADGPAGVLVTGGVGSGKTALAVHVAHLIGARFTDGQLFVPMRDADERSRSVADVLAGLAAALGTRLGDVTAPDAAAVWRAWLARRNLLIVFDDARDESAVRALLPGRGRSRALVTSRFRLSGIEALTRVEPGGLSLAEAVELTAKIAGFESVLSGSEAIVSRIERCEGLPLAVRILAGRIGGHPNPVPRDDLLGQLVLGGLDLPRRYREHFAELAGEDRRVLGLLVSRLRPPYTMADMAEAVASEGDGADAIRSIDALVEANLLVRSDDEVTAHSDLYSMSALAYECARAILPWPS